MYIDVAIQGLIKKDSNKFECTDLREINLNF